MNRIRQSVPTKGIAEKYLVGPWRYVMPDFNKPDHSIIEQVLDDNSSHRVPETQTESADERTGQRG